MKAKVDMLTGELLKNSKYWAKKIPTSLEIGI